MLIEFRCSNFRSIREEQVFSLVASNTDASNLQCVIDPKLVGMSRSRFLRGAAIYGANASGKSNIIAAMRFLKDFVENSATDLKPAEETGTEPFKLDRESMNKPTFMEVLFVTQGTRYLFGVALTSQRVMEEYLIAYPHGLPQEWYHRTWDETRNGYTWARPSSAFKSGRSLQSRIRENTLFLSVGAQFNHPQLTAVYQWFAQELRFLHLDAGRFVSSSFTTQQFQKEEARRRLLHLLQSADIGVVDAATEERIFSEEEIRAFQPPVGDDKVKELASQKFIRIRLSHRVEGADPQPLEFETEESAGTQRFYSLIGPWLDILENGYTVFVDEIETSLHPMLLRELLSLLFCDTHNPKGAQIVFTTHSPILLDGSLLRRDQIWFTEKAPSGATVLYPLTDYQPRVNEALMKGYLAGRYGGVPFIPEGLVP